MSNELLEKTVTLRESTEDGDVRYPNLYVVNVDGCLVTVRDGTGKVRMVNMSSPRMLELKEE